MTTTTSDHLTAADIVQILKGAAETQVLSLTFGSLTFTREGYEAPPPAVTLGDLHAAARQEVLDELGEGHAEAEEWSSEAPGPLKI